MSSQEVTREEKDENGVTQKVTTMEYLYEQEMEAVSESMTLPTNLYKCGRPERDHRAGGVIDNRVESVL